MQCICIIRDIFLVFFLDILLTLILYYYLWQKLISLLNLSNKMIKYDCQTGTHSRFSNVNHWQTEIYFRFPIVNHPLNTITLPYGFARWLDFGKIHSVEVASSTLLIPVQMQLLLPFLHSSFCHDFNTEFGIFCRLGIIWKINDARFRIKANAPGPRGCHNMVDHS